MLAGVGICQGKKPGSSGLRGPETIRGKGRAGAGQRQERKMETWSGGQPQDKTWPSLWTTELPPLCQLQPRKKNPQIAGGVHSAVHVFP